MAPVTKVPAGTTTCPPPALLHALIAAANAAVLSAEPLPLAPNVVTSNVALGKDVGAMPLTMSCACCHGRALTGMSWPAPAFATAAAPPVPASALPASTGAATAAPATAAPRPIACRRDKLSAIAHSSWRWQRIRRREVGWQHSG